MVQALSLEFIRANLLIILIALISISLAITIIILEIRYRKKLKEEKTKREVEEKVINYINEIKKVKTDKSSKDEREKLNKLSLTAKNFFSEFFNLNKNLSYSELIEKFEKLNKYDYINFCKEMLDEYYSEQQVSNEKVNYLADSLVKRILEERKINLKQDKKTQESGEKNIWKSELNNFICHKNEAKNAINKFYQNKKIMELSRKAIKSEHEAFDLLRKNPEIYQELKNLSSILKKMYYFLSSLMNIDYKKGDKHTKKQIKNLIKNWQLKKKKIFEQEKNPVKQHIIDYYLIDEYFRKFMKITKPEFNQDSTQVKKQNK